MIDLSKGVPDLNKQTIEDLAQFRRDAILHTGKIILQLFPQHESEEESQYAVIRLGDYANATMLMKMATILNNLVKENVHEKQRERIYSTLPKFARWE